MKNIWEIVKIVAVFVWKLWKCVVMTAEFCLFWAFVAAAGMLELAAGGLLLKEARRLAGEMPGGGHYGNAELRNCYWNLSCSVQKYFLRDKALSVRLAFSDIFHKAYNNVRLDLGNYILTQTHILGQGRGIYDLQRVSLTLRYNLNVTKSKYKGTGAGKDVRERM